MRKNALPTKAKPGWKHPRPGDIIPAPDSLEAKQNKNIESEPEAELIVDDINVSLNRDIEYCQEVWILRSDMYNINLNLLERKLVVNNWVYLMPRRVVLVGKPSHNNDSKHKRETSKCDNDTHLWFSTLFRFIYILGAITWIYSGPITWIYSGPITWI